MDAVHHPENRKWLDPVPIQLANYFAEFSENVTGKREEKGKIIRHKFGNDEENSIVIF